LLNFGFLMQRYSKEDFAMRLIALMLSFVSALAAEIHFGLEAGLARASCAEASVAASLIITPRALIRQDMLCPDRLLLGLAPVVSFEPGGNEGGWEFEVGLPVVRPISGNSRSEASQIIRGVHYTTELSRTWRVGAQGKVLKKIANKWAVGPSYKYLPYYEKVAMVLSTGREFASATTRQNIHDFLGVVQYDATSRLRLQFGAGGEFLRNRPIQFAERRHELKPALSAAITVRVF
jgi:hypothetical protein